MAHGQPDFGMYAPKTTTFGQADMGELAARLGSIVLFDRRGDILWWDDFEDNATKWNASYTGGSGTWALSTDKAQLGAKSGKLKTASASGATANIRRNFFYPALSKLGVEVAFSFDALSFPIDLILEFDNGVDLTTFKVSYNTDTKVLSLTDENGDSQDIATNVNLVIGSLGFHVLKLVIDMTTSKYVRLLLDSVEYDISVYGGEVSATASVLHVNIYCKVTSGSNLGATTYWDNAIVTQNEP